MAPVLTPQTSTAKEKRHIITQMQSNGFKLDMSDKRLGWLTPTDPGLPMEILRKIFKEQGKIMFNKLCCALYDTCCYQSVMWNDIRRIHLSQRPHSSGVGTGTAPAIF